MANTKIIKRRIKSAKNIGQITKAQQMVSAVKMRKSHQQLIDSKPYNDEVAEILVNLAKEVDPTTLKDYLPSTDKDQNAVVFIIGPSRGLAGSLITNLAKYTFDYINKLDQKAKENNRKLNVRLVTIEKKSKEFSMKLGKNQLAHFTQIISSSFVSISPVSQIALDEFKNSKSEIHVIYTKYISAFIQKSHAVNIAPITKEMLIESKGKKVEGSYLFEPSADRLFEDFFPLYVQTQIYNCFLESVASEHAARMVAMQNATDNAKSLAQQLVLEYNQTRQASVTQEILEVVSSQL